MLRKNCYDVNCGRNLGAPDVVDVCVGDEEDGVLGQVGERGEALVEAEGVEEVRFAVAGVDEGLGEMDVVVGPFALEDVPDESRPLFVVVVGLRQEGVAFRGKPKGVFPCRRRR